MSENTYSSYLHLDTLLSAQDCATDADSELLFLTIHQAKELWFKLMIHELEGARRALYAGDELRAYKILSRVHQIQLVQIRTWDVLSTLSPTEFQVFRESVGRDGASGFQSIQNREIEFLLGEKRRIRSFDTGESVRQVDVIAMHKDPLVQERLTRRCAEPSIYDATLNLLAQRFPDAGIAPRPAQGRDYTDSMADDPRVFAVWKRIYDDQDAHMSLFQLGERLIDLEDAFRRWRFRHLTTVARVIGRSTGTGGSAGLRYLQQTAIEGMEDFLYPELWQVRNAIFEGQ
ncbi:MAG: tryptophan 2,3-dioxygenase family protein [Abyssibacter sp.]|uniref:tryptophan 2,3-dioxygenase n=1 Tax=Abyssibacter sp. TaxID=2320200 RepID=UPI002EA99185|nr:tryptophan 2,3-dioxygenase family protein [Pseudomonadota bacterium]